MAAGISHDRQRTLFLRFIGVTVVFSLITTALILSKINVASEFDQVYPQAKAGQYDGKHPDGRRQEKYQAKVSDRKLSNSKIHRVKTFRRNDIKKVQPTFEVLFPSDYNGRNAIVTRKNDVETKVYENQLPDKTRQEYDEAKISDRQLSETKIHSVKKPRRIVITDTAVQASRGSSFLAANEVPNATATGQKGVRANEYEARITGKISRQGKYGREISESNIHDVEKPPPVDIKVAQRKSITSFVTKKTGAIRTSEEDIRSNAYETGPQDETRQEKYEAKISDVKTSAETKIYGVNKLRPRVESSSSSATNKDSNAIATSKDNVKSKAYETRIPAETIRQPKYEVRNSDEEISEIRIHNGETESRPSIISLAPPSSALSFVAKTEAVGTAEEDIQSKAYETGSQDETRQEKYDRKTPAAIYSVKKNPRPAVMTTAHPRSRSSATISNAIKDSIQSVAYKPKTSRENRKVEIYDGKISDTQIHKKSRPKIIIAAQPRSGSSFLGDAFNQHPDVFYLYEPLHGLVETGRLRTDTTLYFLHDILQCEFRRFSQYIQDIENFRRFSSRALSSPPLCTKTFNYNIARKGYVKPKCIGLRPDNMKSVCKFNYSATVTKILTSRIPRNRIDSLFTLCNLSQHHDCMIIYLVRDPRPLILSHLRMSTAAWRNMAKSSGKTPQPALRSYSTQICRQMEQNINVFHNLPAAWMKEKYKLLRFEDLAIRPMETLTGIFHTAGLPMTDGVVQWIKENTEVEKPNAADEKYEFSTKRNSKTLINRWRLEVDHCLVNIVEESCASVMKLLGYKSVNRSEDIQYDLGVSLLS